MRTSKIKNKVLSAVMIIMALAVGQTAWAASAFSIQASYDSNTHKTTFTITRTGNTTVSETVDWRVVSLSAIESKHYTGDDEGHFYGTVTFPANESTATVTINETTSSGAFMYQNGSTRTYRFEVLDKDGSCLTSLIREMSTGTSVNSSGLFNIKTGVIQSSAFKVTDGGYNQTGNPRTINCSSFYNANDQAYLTFLNAQLRMTLEFDAKEESDGYQYLQILTDNTVGYDSENDGDKGDPGTPSLSRYMAGFEINTGTKDESYKTYTFPVLSVGNNNEKVTNPWGHSSDGNYPLCMQKFRNNCRATDGKLIIPTNFSTISVRFDASGKDNDDWWIMNLYGYIQAYDIIVPTIGSSSDFKVSGGRHQKGNTVYVSVPFSEIVKVTGTPQLNTTWGTLNYYTGSGSNVLTFSGTISTTATQSLNVTSYSLNEGTIKDLAGNNFSTSSSAISKNFGTPLDNDYVWTINDFNELETNTYEIGSTSDLYHLASLVNVTKNDCSGLTFRQTKSSISCGTSYSPIGYYNSNNDNASFNGTYDGGGYTIRDITVSHSGSGNANSYVGIFGYINGGTIQNVVLTNSSFYGFNDVGAIVGRNDNGIIQNCYVYNTVRIYASANSASRLGGVVGNNNGENAKVIGCISAAYLYKNSKTQTSSFGGIVGNNDHGTVKDCLYTGNTLQADSNNGGIVGVDTGNGTFINNYYNNSTIGGVNGSDQDGARRGYAVTLGSHVVLVGDQTAYDVSSLTTIGTGNYALSDGSTIYSAEGQSLTVNYTSSTTGYTLSYNYNDGTNHSFDGGTFSMPSSAVTVNATLTTIPWSGSGTEEDPYLIQYPSQLDLLASRVNSQSGDAYAADGYSGKFFRQTDNLAYNGTVTNNYTPIGYYNDNGNAAFCGTYDGGGYRINGIDITTTGDNAKSFIGIFGYITNATIQNIVLSGSNFTGYRCIGGIAGSQVASTIQNCRVEKTVYIYAGINAGAEHGGIVGNSNNGQILGCFSAATISKSNKTSCIEYGGIVGFAHSYTTISNCLFAGPYIDGDSNKGCIAGYGGSSSLTNNYYTKGDQGGVNSSDEEGACRGYTISMTDNINLTGSRTVYDVSGITAVGSKVLIYNNGTTSTIYSGEGKCLTFVVPDVPIGYDVTSFSYNDGTEGHEVTPTNNVYSLTMPASNTTVSATVEPNLAQWWHADDEHDGSTEAKAYIISTTTGLSMLARIVNTGNSCSGMFFKLGADIVFNTEGLSETDENYTAIGISSCPFEGIFDGAGHTISGIRIYKSGNTEADRKQGLFGYTNYATIKNVILNDASITGNNQVGGIVGDFNFTVTIENCRVMNSQITITGSGTQGGAIVGYYNNTLTLTNNYYYHCTVTNANSSATNNIGASWTDRDGARCVYALTLGNDITANGDTVLISYNTYCSDNTTITLSGFPEGYTFEGYTVTKNSTVPAETVTVTESAGIYTFTMPANDVTVSANLTTIPWTGSGTEDDPYTLIYASQFELLAQRVNSGTGDNYAPDGYSGKHFRLGANMTITTPVGASSSKSFKGTFDGDGKTMTLNLKHTGGGNAFIAPFRFVNGATIKQLHTAGTITTDGKMAGGIIGDSWGTSNLQRCRSSVAINSSIDGDGTHGGLVGRVYQGTLSITDCLFDGSITGSSTNCCGGFVGWKESSLEMNHCLQAGNLTGIDDEDGDTFCRYDEGSINFSTCYYKTAYGTEHGTSASSMTKQLLKEKLGSAWEISGDEVVPLMRNRDISTITINNINEALLFTGSPIDISYTVTDSYGNELTKGTDYTETYSPTIIQEAGNYTLTIEGTGNESTGYYGSKIFNFKVYKPLSGSGTQTEPYLISSADDWEWFAYLTASNSFAGKYIQLTNDISVSKIASCNQSFGFSGNFNGNGHKITLTLNCDVPYTSSPEQHQGLALFRLADNGCVIRNLTVDGTITTVNKFAAGFISYITKGDKSIELRNCRSSISIHSAISGDATSAGFVAAVKKEVNLTVNNCLFDGSFVSSTATQFAGIVGWRDSEGVATITNSLVAPASIDLTASNGNHQTFCRYTHIKWLSLSSCYYLSPIGTAQGSDASGMTKQELKEALGDSWEINGDDVLPIMNDRNLATSIISGVDANYQYTYSPIAVSYTVTDANGMQLTKGTDYTETLSPAIVQRPGNYTLTIVGTGNETVGYFGSKTVNFTVTNVLSGNGEQDNPYMLNDDVDWDTFASNINDGTSYSGMFVKLGGNITINTMAATNYTKSFSGTFDGDGKTMTLDLTATSDGCAPFLYLYNATVKNLNIDGRITTGHRFGASIAAHIYGSTNYIQNCTSTVEITSTFAEANTDGTHGGFVAVNDAGTLNISDCVFAGKLLGANASSNGGFVGWNENTKVNYTDCLFAPAQITMSDENSCTFNRNGKNTFTNTYYLTQFGEAQGTLATAALSEAETVPSSLSGTVVLRREFTGGKASTVCLPFEQPVGTEGTYYTFGGVAYDDLEGKWKATMTEYTGAALAANTPYLFVPAGSEAHAPVLFHGTAGYDASNLATTNSDWSFVGTYETKVWTAGDVGNDYGFAATSGKAVDGVTDVNAGDFVKLAAGAWIRPMRSYLRYTGTDNPFAGARGSESNGNGMPSSISVILVNANGETTEIETTDFTDFTDSDAWYTLDGRKLDKKPIKKGMYINNGRKVVVK